MIGSNKIGLLTVVLTVLALAFAVFVMMQAPTDTWVTESDYDTDAAGAEEILFDGEHTTANSGNVLIEGNTVTILGGGKYRISGDLRGSLIVDSDDGAEVHLILDGASITAQDSPALSIKQAEKTVLTLADGSENSLTDSAARTDAEQTAALYSRDDLTINGSGSLTVTGNYRDGIKVNDNLKLLAEAVAVTAEDDGLNVNDSVLIRACALTVTAGGDAIKCEHEDEEKGQITIEGGTVLLQSGEDGLWASSDLSVTDTVLQITAGDDAIHSEQTVTLAPKSLEITKCREGIEGAFVTVNNGEITIISEDDGINAVGMNSAEGFGRPRGMQKVSITEEDLYLTVNGGNISVSTKGDGVDSNGAAVLNGGSMTVFGPENNGNSSLDFEYGFLINGGTLVAAGSSGMAELPSTSSEQPSLVFYLEEQLSADSTISLTDTAGNELVCANSDKQFDWVCVSAPGLQIGGKYTLSINGETIAEAEVTGIVTSTGNSGRRKGF